MNIFLTHAACRGNKGDAAIVSSMISELSKEFPNSDFTLETLDLFQPGETFEGVPQVHSFFYYSMFQSKVWFLRYPKTVWVCIAAIIWAFTFRLFGIQLDFLLGKEMSETFKTYGKADLVIPIGGGYLTVKKGIRNTAILLLRTLPIYFASIIKKPIFLYSQSIGPFGNKFQEWLTWLAIKQAKGVFVRETISENFVLQKGFPREKLFLVPDTAFLFEVGEPNKEVQKEKPLIGITVRLWFDSCKQKDFENEMSDFAKCLLQDGYRVIFISQVDCTNHKDDDDREVVKNIEKILGQNEDLIYMYEKCNHFEIKKLYSELHVMVGTRMHSNIFALTSYVPALAIAYEHKTTGIMRDLGLSKWAVKIEDVESQKLKALFDNLISERNKYLDTLNTNLPEYLDRARKIAPKIKELAGH